MGQITVVNHLTLDGVMQAPGRPDEDTRDGFTHGGWAQPGNDPVMGEYLAKGMSRGGALLLGRRTYEDFHEFWPNQTDNPFTEVLNQVTKYVASTTLVTPLPWQNSVLLDGDAGKSVAALKADGPDVTIMGSGKLIRTLVEYELIDEYLLMVHPIVLGQGRRLFADHGPHASLSLVESVPTTTGVVIARYRAK